MVEVNTLRDKFHLTFMEVGNNRKFYEAFLESMREENIHYKEYGEYYRMLPHTVLSKKR